MASKYSTMTFGKPSRKFDKDDIVLKDAKKLESISETDVLEGIYDLSYYSYFYQGIAAALALMDPDDRKKWAKEMSAKLYRLKSLAHLDSAMRKVFERIDPELFGEE